MTKEECQTCAQPSKQCQDKRHRGKIHYTCWNHEAYAPFPAWINVPDKEVERMCAINCEDCEEKDTCTICKIKKDVIEEMSETYPDIDLYFER